MPRWSWLRTALLVLLAVPAPRAEAAEPLPLDPYAPCVRPGGSALCALKSYLGCVLYDAPDLCAAVKLEGPVARDAIPDSVDTELLTAAWTLPFERLLPEGFALHLYDAGLVDVNRFDGATARDPTDIEGFIHELVLDVPEPNVNGLVYRLSFFLRRIGDTWQMEGWSSTRAGACEGAAADWGPCRWFVKKVRPRDVIGAKDKLVWASAKLPGRLDYPPPGIDIKLGMPNQPVTAPFSGTILRRALKYPDTPLYDWVVIAGEGPRANMTVKLAMVGRDGPPAGAHVDAAAALGKPQWLDTEHPGAGKFIHIELLRDGQQIDPRTIMRERKTQETEQ